MRGAAVGGLPEGLRAGLPLACSGSVRVRPAAPTGSSGLGARRGYGSPPAVAPLHVVSSGGVASSGERLRVRPAACMDASALLGAYGSSPSGCACGCDAADHMCRVLLFSSLYRMNASRGSYKAVAVTRHDGRPQRSAVRKRATASAAATAGQPVDTVDTVRVGRRTTRQPQSARR